MKTWCVWIVNILRGGLRVRGGKGSSSGGTGAKNLATTLVAAVLCVGMQTGCYMTHIRPADEQGALPRPSPGKALVVFARPSGYLLVLETRLYDGDRLIGVLNTKNYALYEATPGKHSFNAMGQSRDRSHFNSFGFDFVDADLSAGRTYYIIIRPVNKAMAYAPAPIFAQSIIMEPITPESEDWRMRDEWLSNMKRVEMNDETLAWELQHDAEARKLRDWSTNQQRSRTDKKALRSQDGV